MFVGKKVLEIGCGHGLLGVLAKKLGAAEVCFQDYNQSVIEGLTRQTVELNCGSLENVEFTYGDWMDLKSHGKKYDVILGS